MKDYTFQYRREQRAETTITASSPEEARRQAKKWVETLDLYSEDDTSDDPGELEEI